MKPEQKTTFKALVVDDQAELRDAICDELLFMNYEVKGAEDGKKALEILENYKPDIIFSDIRMPIMDGMAFLKEVRGRSPLCPVFVLMSGFSDVTVPQALDAGAQAFVGKPLGSTVIEMVDSYYLRGTSPQLNVVKELNFTADNNLGKNLWFGNNGLSFETQDVFFRTAKNGQGLKITVSAEEVTPMTAVAKIVWLQEMKETSLLVGVEWMESNKDKWKLLLKKFNVHTTAHVPFPQKVENIN